MKKIIAAILLLALTVSILSCGKDEKKLTEFEKTVGDINGLSADFNEALSILPEGTTVYTSLKNLDDHKGFVAYGASALLYGTETVTEIGTSESVGITQRGVYVFELTRIDPTYVRAKLAYFVAQIDLAGADAETVKQYLISEARKNGATEEQIAALDGYFSGNKLIVGEGSPLWKDILYSREEVVVDIYGASGGYFVMHGGEDTALVEKESYENGNIKTLRTYSRYPDGMRYLDSVTEYRENGGIMSETLYHENGSLKQTAEYPEGWTLPSKLIEYYDDGALKTDLKREMPNGEAFNARTVRTVSTSYYRNGVKSAETYYGDNGETVNISYGEDGNKSTCLVTAADGSYTHEEYYPNGILMSRTVVTKGHIISLDEYYENGFIKKKTDYFENSSTIKSESLYSRNIENFLLEKTEYYHMDVTIVEVELFPKTYVIYDEGEEYPREEYSFYNDGTQMSATVRYDNGQIKEQYEFFSGGKLSMKKTFSEGGELLSHEEYYKSGTLKYHSGSSEDENGAQYDFVINYGEDGGELDIVQNFRDGSVKTFKFHTNGMISYYSYHDADGNTVEEVNYNENGEPII